MEQKGKTYTRKKIENFSYGLTDTIGRGYSSQVYRGRNDLTMQPVAVKVIDLKGLKCQINRVLLASQIEILRSLRDVPYVLRLQQVYTTKNNTYIITQLCDTDLASKVKKGLSQNEAITYMEQIIQGYSKVFQRSLIHRDLKPANLLVTDKNQIKIADFGFGVKQEQCLKPSKYNVGSPLYMAPQSLKKNEYSFKTDIWAIGIIFFQMLTGDTPWRAKNQKQLLKKIQSQKIPQILIKQKFSQISKDFLMRALNQDKNLRMSPQQLLSFNLRSNNSTVLTQKHLNNFNIINGSKKFQSIIAQSPNKARSVQKRLFTTGGKQIKKSNNGNLQNMSIKNIQNYRHGYQQVHQSTNFNNDDGILKEDKKLISKILIAQVHFCRFLYKLYGRMKQSIQYGLLLDNIRVNSIFKSFTNIIQNKICKLKNFEKQNYLSIQNYKYIEYKKTTDYKKLHKISKDYFQRYSTQLSVFWQNKTIPTNTIYRNSIQQVGRCIQFLLVNLKQKSQLQDFINIYSKDIIILDYLITCKQLLQMIQKQIKLTNNQNYQKFAKKSRIQQIVQGSTTSINKDLYQKIVQRGKAVIGRRQQVY